MKTICVIQARLGSTRLPGKVLLPINGKPIVQHVYERCCQISGIDEVVVALPMENSPLKSLLRALAIPSYTAYVSENDLIHRYRFCANEYKADVIMRITADCPLINPSVCEKVVYAFKCGNYDYTSNVIQPTYPDGYDCEVFSFECLGLVNVLAKKPEHREHVTSYILENVDKFKTCSVTQDKDESDIKLSIDTWEDYERIRKMVEQGK